MRISIDGPGLHFSENAPDSAPMHWYAVQTRSNFEKRIDRELGEKGIRSYFPCYEEVHQWKDRKRVVQVPLFPGYVFVRITDCPEERLSVRKTPGAVRILGQQGSIEPVPDCEIDAIQTVLHSKLPLLANPFLREGALVRVRRGPLEGVEGVLSRVKNQMRLVMSVALLCRSVAVEVDANDVEALPGRTPQGVAA